MTTLPRVSALALCALTGPITVAQTLQPRPAPPPTSPAAPAEAAAAESRAVILPAGTTLQVQVPAARPMKAGEALDATLMYPVYLDGRVVLPRGTRVQGQVTGLDPDKHMRTRARLHGDFTPFHEPEVHFGQLLLPGGATLPISAPVVSNGAPVLELSSPGVRPRRSIFARGWASAKARARQPVDFFTQPGLGDRAKQLLYHQLPYHPEEIAAHTAWNFELAQPITLPGSTVDAEGATQALAARSATEPDVWSVHALLKDPLSSATSRIGEPVKALVVEPVYDREHHLVVPQGSVLVGRVTQAQAARSLGRNGKLRFSFQQIQLPEGPDRSVDSSLAGAATDSRQDLSIDAEGTITPRSKSSVIVPLALAFLAGRALDSDGNQVLQSGVASNGFGLLGRIVGTAAGSRELAAGIGYYAAALSIYENWLTPGRDVTFPLDTRIEIETSPLRAQVLQPGGASE